MLCLVIASDGTAPNLTAASQNLYELIREQALVAYPDEAIRLAISRAVAIETPRGWKISKEKISHRIDVVVALALAAYAAVQSPEQSTLWSPAVFLAGDAPAPWPQRAAMIYAVLIPGTGAFRGQAAVAYFAKLDYTGRQPLLLADVNLAPLTPQLLAGVVSHCNELAQESQAAFGVVICTTAALAGEFPRAVGYHVDHLVAAFDEGMLELRASYHVAAGKLKICAEPFARHHPAHFIDPTYTDDAELPLKVAALLGVILAFDEERSQPPPLMPPGRSSSANLSNANLSNRL
jgi:hypothetical protein